MLPSRYSGTEPFYMIKDTYKTPMSTMHYHSAYELYYLINGERDYFIGDRFVKIFDGDLLLIPPNTLHRTAGKGATRILMHFEKEFLLRYFTSKMVDSLLGEAHPTVFRPGKEDKAFLNSLFSTMLDAYNSSTHMDDAAFDRAVFCLPILLSTIQSAQNNYVAQHCSDQRVSRIVQYINDNYGKISTIDEIANQFFISKFYLCRLFTKELGVSLISYLNTVKIRAACDLLKESEMTVTEIAMECGFHSSSYFSKVFKTETNLSPGAYRQQNLSTK